MIHKILSKLRSQLDIPYNPIVSVLSIYYSRIIVRKKGYAVIDQATMSRYTGRSRGKVVLTLSHSLCTKPKASKRHLCDVLRWPTVAPEIVPFVIGEGPANWGDTVTATCTVLKGDHPIQIEWALNGEPISRNHYDISIVNTSKRVSVLTIDAVTARHAGEYTCSVSNAAGGTSYSASLAVNGTRTMSQYI